jgi:hypothetical protein
MLYVFLTFEVTNVSNIYVRHYNNMDKMPLDVTQAIIIRSQTFLKSIAEANYISMVKSIDVNCYKFTRT